MIILSLCYSCQKDYTNPNDLVNAKNGITSKADFLNLCEANTYPFTQLSETTKQEFANSLVFVDGQFRGYTSNVIYKELNFEQYYLFMQKILGANPIFEFDEANNSRLPYDYQNYENSKRSTNGLINPNLPYRMAKPERCPGGPPPHYPCENCEGSCVE